MPDIFPESQNNRIIAFDGHEFGAEIPEATKELRDVLARVNSGELATAAPSAAEIERRYGGIWVWD